MRVVEIVRAVVIEAEIVGAAGVLEAVVDEVAGAVDVTEAVAVVDTAAVAEAGTSTSLPRIFTDSTDKPITIQ